MGTEAKVPRFGGATPYLVVDFVCYYRALGPGLSPLREDCADELFRDGARAIGRVLRKPLPMNRGRRHLDGSVEMAPKRQS